MEAPNGSPESSAHLDGPLARVAGVFGFPGPTFASIARRPRWVMPLILLTVLSIAATAALLPRLDFDAAVRERLNARPQKLPEERIEQIVEAQKRFAGVTSWVWGALAPTAIALVLALVFWLSFKAFGWDATFRQSLGVTAHALLPTIGATMLLIIFATRLDIVNPADIGDLTHSNAGLLVDRQANPVLHSLAASIDVFSLWSLALLVIGFATAANVTRGKAAGILVTLWAIYVLGKAGLTALMT